MITDETDIRQIVERWVGAINAADIDGVLAEHTADIVMFDVPPPYRGVRGLDAYRDSWQPFFDWLASGAIFELEELDVTAGDTVAYAYALVRCGKPDELAATPELRLRITLGLHREQGAWRVAHEHHSFPLQD